MVLVSVGIYAKEPTAELKEAAPVTLKGIVSDKLSGESLTGVKVKLEGAKSVEYTDFDGKFEISNLSPGKYTIVLEYISYNSRKLKEITVSHKSSGNLDIELEPSTIAVSN